MRTSLSGLNVSRLSGSALIAILIASQSMFLMADDYEQCLLRQAQEGDDTLTLKAVRDICIAESAAESADGTEKRSALAERIKAEQETENSRFVLLPHRPNYVLPLSHNNSPNFSPFDGATADNFSSTEIKFQLSFKAILMDGVFGEHDILAVAYTNTSWWQAYNENSAPFRETNHEPELFLAMPTPYSLMGFDVKAVLFGLSHQSNGKPGSLSRSWNRLYADFIIERGNFVASIKPWWRIPESEKEFEGDPKGDDNPDIDEYMGYGELHLAYVINEHNLGMLLRNNLRSDNRGAVQVDWSFPISERFRGYVQYFNGYGESLIDYNDSTNRFSIGVMLTDWL